MQSDLSGMGIGSGELTAIAVACGIALLVACLLLAWQVRSLARQLRSPAARAARLVLRGHARARAEDEGEALVLYRAAALALCRTALRVGAAKDDAAAAALQSEEALADYNAQMPLAMALAFALHPKGEAVGGAAAPGEAEPGSEPDPGAAAGASAEGADGAGPGAGAPPADTQAGDVEQQAPGSVVLVCSRCASRNCMEERPRYFRCFSCRATVLPWAALVVSPEPAEEQAEVVDEEGAIKTAAGCKGRLRRGARGCSTACTRCRCSGHRKVEPGYPELQDLSWEASGLGDLPKHPTGFGRASEAPEGCQHHTQVGPTCGIAAVNNVVTNCGAEAVGASRMMEISQHLGQAETAIRCGAQSVEEAGEEQNVSELYATAVGGHFDVQTLQVAFDEAGFHMWYMPAQKLNQPSTLFKHDDDDELAGYVVHRRDPLTPSRDHWFVLRRHEGPPAQHLMQDSLYEKVFVLTATEAHQLLASLPQGAIFAISRQSAES